MATQRTFCRICEALCGLEMDIETPASGRPTITGIRPDASHPSTRGFACVKGLQQHQIFDSPDRLSAPLERRGDDQVPVSWEHANAAIGRKLREIHDAHGPDSIGMYIGTAAGFGVLHPIFAQGFLTGVGSRSMYCSATQDCSNKFSVAEHLYGFPFTQTFPDIEHCECLIIVGANPVVSKWSFLQVSNVPARLKAMAQRGVKLYVVDPRRNETAKVVEKAGGEHCFIRPGTDVFFYLAFLNALLEVADLDRAHIERHMRGFDTLRELAQGWTPERCAEVTGVPATTLRAMVKAYNEARGAALYCSTGVNMGGRGALAYWLQEAINAISGNLDRQGGTLVGEGIVNFPALAHKHGFLLRKDRSRIGDLPSVNDTFPGGVLADEILTKGPGQLRALIITGGNPLLTMPNSGRLREAFNKLDLLVCLDIQLSESAALAHYVLPCTSPLERPDLPFAFPLLLGLQSRPYLQATDALLPPLGESRDEATIYLDLCRAAGFSIFGSRIVQRLLELARNRHARRHPGSYPALPQEALLSLMLRASRQGSFRRLVERPSGVREDAPTQPGTFLGQRVLTSDGRVDLAPAALLPQARALAAAFEAEKQAAGLRLITKRAVHTHNSWTHNVEAFVEGSRDRNYLYMHPEDAAAAGLSAGALADVRSETASVRLSVKLLDDLMPGTVALPHGWGHQASGLSTAKRTAGVNVNILAADGPKAVEPVSGMARLTGIPVAVTPAAGPQDTQSWSGLPEDRWPRRSEPRSHYSQG